MMTESVVLQGEDKFIIISRNGKKVTGAHCNQVVVKDNLTTRQIIASLNGHIIIDTGIIPKIDLLDYKFIPVLEANVKYFKITSFLGHELRQLNSLLADEDKPYRCSCGNWEFYGKDNAILMFLDHVNIVKENHNDRKNL